MKIKPEISSSKLTDLTAEGKITQVPIVTTSEAETTITLKDGTTIMIAGLKKDKKEKEVKKIPVLGDIPLLGFPFRSFSSTNTKTELVIFLTPYIVSGEEPLDYESLTKDKDIGYIQSLAYAKEKTGVPLVPRIEINVANSEDYKRLVFEKIKSSWMLSRSGAKRQKGKVELSFSVDSDGQLKDEPQVLSSSNQDLDNLAVGCVKKAAPFAPFPATLKKSQQVFRVNLAYE
jgi:TonB family protein